MILFSDKRFNKQFLTCRYKDMWRHLDGTIAHYTGPMFVDSLSFESSVNCGALTPDGIFKLKRKKEYIAGYLCEYPTTTTGDPANIVNDIVRKGKSSKEAWSQTSLFLQCPQSHVTHTYLACDEDSACYGVSGDCAAGLTSFPLPFVCYNDVEHVPYTLVCDHRSDCSDHSDEDFCHYAPCSVSSQFQCTDKAVNSSRL